MTEGDLKVELRRGESLKHVSEHDCLCDGTGRIPAFKKKKSCERFTLATMHTERMGSLHVLQQLEWIGREK